MRTIYFSLGLCIITTVCARSYYPQTHNPLTHTCLRIVALTNIIKGSGIQFPIPFLEIDEEINLQRLSCGAALLAMSHLLHFIEHIEHPEYKKQEAKKNSLVLTVAVPEDSQQY